MNNVREQIAILCKAQDASIEKQKLLSQLESIPYEIATIETTMEKYKDELDTEKKLLHFFENEYGKSENNLNECTSDIDKSKFKLDQTKSNKEYQSTLKEIDILNKKQHALEDSMLHLLEKIETSGKSIADKLKLLTIRKETLLKKKTGILKDKIQIEFLLKNLDKKIKNVRQTADQNTISVFDKVAKKVNGTPVVSVRNSACMGCNMSVPPQLSNELQNCNELKFCPHCGRIVYWNYET